MNYVFIWIFVITQRKYRKLKKIFKKNFKSYLRKAKRNKTIQEQLQGKLSTLQLTMPGKDQQYFEDSKQIFYNHYCKGYSIAKITSQSNSILCDADIHLRIDFIIDHLGPAYFGIDWLYPGIYNFIDNVQKEC